MVKKQSNDFHWIPQYILHLIKSILSMLIKYRSKGYNALY